MKSYLNLLIALLISESISAQINNGDEPYKWNERSISKIEFYNLPKPDVAALAAEDLHLDTKKHELYRFGANVAVELDINNSGKWIDVPNGDRIWRLGINSSGAKSLNFVFDQFSPSDGGRVFVYSSDGSQLKGSFTAESASPIGTLGVGLILSESIVIEYHEPAAVAGTGYFRINNITHGYRTALKSSVVGIAKAGPFGDSGDCNINVNCPEGLPYAIQRRSVALIVVNGNSLASGALVNNTAMDNRPFFLTADHAIPDDTDDIQNWVFYFNHEADDCNGETGAIDQSISGATFRAQNTLSDFGLIEFNSAVPSSYNVCYSGWDATDSESTVTSAYGIHHPAGDIKKISIEEDAPYHISDEGFGVDAWWIDQWEAGVTEGGSSGSPLFSQDGLVIGQLTGGTAACDGSVSNGGLDFYGRLGISWDTGDSPNSRLKDWLDPIDSGELTIENSCNSSLLENNVSLGQFSTTEPLYCEATLFNSSISVYNIGSNDVTNLSGTISINGISEVFNWIGDIPIGSDGMVELGVLPITSGENIIEVDITTVNGQLDLSPTLNTISQTITLVANPEYVTVNILLDNYPQETTWEIRTDQSEILYSGGPYTDDEDTFSDTFCMSEGCFSFEIFDAASDGICCSFGEGSYNITAGQGNQLATGGEFEASEETEFCIGVTGVNNNQKLFSKWQIYPNPAQTYLTLKRDGGLEPFSYAIFDITGRLISSKSGASIQNDISNIDVSDWPNGIYVFELTTNYGSTRRKFVVAK